MNVSVIIMNFCLYKFIFHLNLVFLLCSWKHNFYRLLDQLGTNSHVYCYLYWSIISDSLIRHYMDGSLLMKKFLYLIFIFIFDLNWFLFLLSNSDFNWFRIIWEIIFIVSIKNSTRKVDQNSILSLFFIDILDVDLYCCLIV